MVYSLEDAIVICKGFLATTRRAVCIAREIKGHAWQGPTHCWDKKNGKDYVHWMVPVMHHSCATAHYDNGVNEIVMIATSFWCVTILFYYVLETPHEVDMDT